MKIIVNQPGTIDVIEDDWNGGYLEQINVWDFNVDGTYNSAEELIERIQNATGMFFGFKPADFMLNDFNGYSMLTTSQMVNVDNDKPTEAEYEDWKKGKIKLYSADLSLPVMVGELRDMSREDADEFGFDLA